ncbi:DUF305 domain-containing protein [Microbacterium laevaniformans]|uniref:DUF305 domain-containing protein n=1 Tax=Microbacterium laevaniformans TaxID=36807 RepID=UPI00195D1D1F|nr:DUF305 domain-containing protein [Microbacterium laevaniformans]MBM7752271.1 uncharacterized protein (DUF305 family) [Microbacterium laevaniformans]GLJ64674.1 DUF305 domain-containing protein [Microbacterium laevaniformans]
MRFRAIAVAAGAASMALAASLALAGCAPTDGSTSGMDSDMMNSTPEASAEFNAVDEMFVTMMIPHHEQAIEMADALLAKEDIDDRVVTLAEQIEAAQAPEIETMKGWLEDWGIPVDDSMSDSMEGMDHGDGMMGAADMDELEAATGADATRLFLEGMIVHHEGALHMAEVVLDGGQNPDVAALAQQIVDGQTAEISQMKQILESL